MQSTNLFKKFQRPTLPIPTLHRTQLLSSLRTAILSETERNTHQSRYKLALLCAPAGYGKTTLLADFAASTNLTCCWYLLEETDANAVLFLRTLLVGLRQIFPQLDIGLETTFAEILTRNTHSLADIYRPAIDLLCRSLEADVSERFALFLCRYERVNENQEMVHLINYLLTKLPDHALLVIESRAYPRIDLTSLMMHDELYVLNSDALRFSAQEISALAQLSSLKLLPSTRAEQLATFFDGWITGVLLATDMKHLQNVLPNQNRLFGWKTLFSEEQLSVVGKSNLFTYIVDDVFQRQTALYHFLQSASILQYMEAEICNALLKITDAAERLARLEELGLFVSSHENQQQIIYTCHPGIRDLLSMQLQYQNGDQFSALHLRAAEVWCTHQDYEQAIYHALQIHDYDLATQLILDTYQQRLHQGNLHILTSWISALPLSTRENTPHLLLIEAYIALTYGQHPSAFAILEKVPALLPTKDTAQRQRLQFTSNILRGRALYQTEDYWQAQVICQQTLQQLTGLEEELRIAVLTLSNLCTIRLGDFSTGIPHLQEMLHQGDTRLPPHQIAEIHEVLGTAYDLIGNFVLAEHHLLHALKRYELLQDARGTVNVLLCKGTLAQEQGRYTEAETLFQKALLLTRTAEAARSREPYALANLGLLSLEQKKYTAALTFYEDGLEIAHHGGNHSIIHSILAHLSMVYLLLGDAASAHLFLDQASSQLTGSQKTKSAQREHALIYGLLLLYQEQYDDACLCLQEAVQAASGAGQERELQVARLRLAACHLARKRNVETLHLLKEVAYWLTKHMHYRQFVLVELQWLPALQHIIKYQPQLAHLQALLFEETAQLQQVSHPVVASNSRELELAAPELTIRALGETVVLLNGQPIKRWRMARAMELFFLLLDANHPLSKEQIITELWPHFDEQINQTFHSTLHQLRKLLGTSVLIFQAGGYSLQMAERYGTRIWYDVQLFQTYRAKAEEALAQEDKNIARTELLQAVELYRGDYGLAFYSNWCIARRHKLRTAYLQARRQLARIAWEREAFAEGIEHWQHMLQVDNCLEEAHLGLMQCYAHLGQRSLALRQYRDCQQLLRQELDTEPEPALQQLYQRLIH